MCVKFKLVMVDSRVKQGDTERQVSSSLSALPPFHLVATATEKANSLDLAHICESVFPALGLQGFALKLAWEEPALLPGHPRRRKMRDNPCTARLNFCNVSQERNCACLNEQFFLTVLVVYGMQGIGFMFICLVGILWSRAEVQ